MGLQRAAHPTEKCSSCAGYFAQLGDRDQEIRSLRERASKTEHAQRELDLVVSQLNSHGAPTHTAKGERYAVAGRVMVLARFWAESGGVHADS